VKPVAGFDQRRLMAAKRKVVVAASLFLKKKPKSLKEVLLS
jgi:hypothetical protein